MNVGAGENGPGIHDFVTYIIDGKEVSLEEKMQA
jgi:hypothetical protein